MTDKTYAYGMLLKCRIKFPVPEPMDKDEASAWFFENWEYTKKAQLEEADYEIEPCGENMYLIKLDARMEIELEEKLPKSKVSAMLFDSMSYPEGAVLMEGKYDFA